MNSIKNVNCRLKFVFKTLIRISVRVLLFFHSATFRIAGAGWWLIFKDSYYGLKPLKKDSQINYPFEMFFCN